MLKEFFFPKIFGLVIVIEFSSVVISVALPPQKNCREALAICIEFEDCNVLLVRTPLWAIPYESFSSGLDTCSDRLQQTFFYKEPCEEGCKVIEMSSLCSVPCKG